MEANFFPAVAFAEIKHYSSQTRCLGNHTRTPTDTISSVLFSSACSQAPVRRPFGFFFPFSFQTLNSSRRYHITILYATVFQG